MDRKKKNLELFRQLTGKTVISVPKQNGPVPQYWGSKVVRFWE